MNKKTKQIPGLLQSLLDEREERIRKTNLVNSLTGNHLTQSPNVESFTSVAHDMDEQEIKERLKTARIIAKHQIRKRFH